MLPFLDPAIEVIILYLRDRLKALAKFGAARAHVTDASEELKVKCANFGILQINLH